jgi:L-alanine-DL-glutamate epimerase-like enolase superfamily enzyme
MRIVDVTVSGACVTVRGAGGLVGRGEGRCCAEAARRAIGRSPFEMEAVFDEVAEACGDTAGGLDMALWDLAAQAAGKRVREIFGKPYRGEAQVCRVVEDEAALARVPCGERRGLHLRAGGVEEALAIGRRLEKLHLEFWSSPLDEADLSGYRRLREEIAVPVAAGAGVTLDVLLRDFVQNRLVDVALADVARCGLTGLRRLAYFGWVFGVRVAPVCSGSPAALAAATEAALCFPPVTSAIAAPPVVVVTRA